MIVQTHSLLLKANLTVESSVVGDNLVCAQGHFTVPI